MKISKPTEGIRNIFEIMEKIEEVEDTIFLAHKSQYIRDVYKVNLLYFLKNNILYMGGGGTCI